MQKRIDKLKATMYNTPIDGTQSRRNRRHLRRSVCDWCFSFFLLFIKKGVVSLKRGNSFLVQKKHSDYEKPNACGRM